MLDASRVLAAAHKSLGAAATYTAPAPGSPALVCAAIVNAADDVQDLGPAAFVVAKMTIEVRAAEIAQPVKGGIFAIGAARYRIAAAPKRIDPDNLVWTCQCDPLAD